jgi:hypothetical protein
LSDNWQQKRTKRERVSYETKLMSGNEADHNQSGMREVEIKTDTERDKSLRPCRQKRAYPKEFLKGKTAETGGEP